MSLNPSDSLREDASMTSSNETFDQTSSVLTDSAGSQKKTKKEAKQEAKLTLESFILYKWVPAKQNYEFFPTPRQAHKTEERMVVSIGDVPFPVNVPHPKNALTALYGFRDALEELQRHLKVARERDMGNIKVSFKVMVRAINMGTTDLSNLQDTDFLNLRRLQKSLADIIIDGVNDLMAKESNKTGRVAERATTILEACRRPDLVCDVIRSEKIFSHIKVVAYMIPDENNSNRGRQVATVFTDRTEELSFRGDMPFDIELPRIGS